MNSSSSFFFFFSSRRRHTRLTCDWSSDVCSSDLTTGPSGDIAVFPTKVARGAGSGGSVPVECCQICGRSEERRVGKEGRSRGVPDALKKKKKQSGWELDRVKGRNGTGAMVVVGVV